MFGNIKPLKYEMKIKDYSNYKAYYCGLCKSMGKKYAGLCNLGLSYEAVFIAIVISAMCDDKVKLKKQGCILHPFAKKYMVVDNESVDKAALVNVLLMYNSLKDNVRDENDIKSRLACGWFKRPYKKAAADMPYIDSLIYEKLDDLALVEESLCDIPERASEPFAELMGEIAKKLIPYENDDVYWFGFFLGKWLYITDAYADIEKDIKSKSYNPFVMMNRGASADEVKRLSKDDAEFILDGTMNELASIYKKLKIKRNNDIIENILFDGMPARTCDVLMGKACKKEKKNEIEL